MARTLLRTMRSILLLAALALTVAACSGNSGLADNTSAPPTTTLDAGAIEDDRTIAPSYAGTVPAPEFPDGLAWLNTEGPIRLDSLKGKIVLLDFWTYGCINCIHIIPDLERLEIEYAEELVVVGVHSAKFTNESETANIREVVLRYGIKHPVVNDRDFAVWRAWGAQAWPTVALIDPAGNVVGLHAGEGVYETVEPVIASLVNEFDSAGLLDRTPLELDLEAADQVNTILSYPGKVAANGAGTQLFISDTGHNRVITADAATGEIVAVYGNGSRGFENGPALAAEFDGPQGLAFDDASGTLYVADTNNHAIRTIDVATGDVTTLAGTGQLGWPPAAGLVSDVRLNSPWGLALRDQDLWVAMAGFHQVWVIDLGGGVATPAVGSASEGVANGPLVEAQLAQPSGVAFDGNGRLYFADSESSAIRWADVLESDGSTGTLAGSDQDLFDFGDVDGTGTAARLQHPLGVVWDPVSGDLIIADTYNSKLKRIDALSGETETYLGSSQGWADGTAPQFYEPGGLAIAARTLYVADTNNHVIRTVDLETHLTSTLVLHGIEQFTPPPDAADFPGAVVLQEAIEVAAGPVAIELAIDLPDGYKVNEQAPSSAWLSLTGVSGAFPDGTEHDLTGTTFPVQFDLNIEEGEGLLTADITLLYCRADSAGLCIIDQVRINQPLTVSASGSEKIALTYSVTLPDFADS